MIVTLITKPSFLEPALELIEALKKKVTLNLIYETSPKHLQEQGAKINSNQFNKPLPIENAFKKADFERIGHYFTGVNAACICPYTEKDTNLIVNTWAWIELFKEYPEILKADCFITETIAWRDFYLLLKLRNRKLCYIIHDPLPHTGEVNWKIELLKKIVYPFIGTFITYSDSSANIFIEHFKKYKQKVISLKMPVFANQFISVKSSKKNAANCKVLFFGRISPYKGTDLFYSAAEKLSVKFNDVKFIIAGKNIPNYNPEFLKKQNDNIIILNRYIENAELAELMTEAWFCVLPYTDATQSGVIMTCYAYGLPVLVSDCPGLLEYSLNPADFSFKSGNLQELTEKMATILSMPQLLSEYKKKIGDYASEVSENNVSVLLRKINPEFNE